MKASEITDAMRLGFHRTPNYQCEHGKALPAQRCQVKATRKIGHQWFCDAHGEYVKPVAPSMAAVPAKAVEELAVFIPCILPTTTSQQKGAFGIEGGGVRFFKKTKTKKAEALIASFLRPHAPPAPFDGPLCLVMTLAFPWRKTERKTRMKTYSQYPIPSRPDVENLFKLIGDQMTELGFWHDDGQLSTLRISKVWSDTPGIRLVLTGDLAIDRAGQVAPLETARSTAQGAK